MLSDNAKELATGPNLAMFASKLPSGKMQVQPVWCDTDGENIRVNTEVHRRKFKNVQADPTATVTILDANSPWRWAEIRGTVISTQTGPEARAHIDALAKVYLGVDDYPNPIESERVILVVKPDQVFDFNPGG